MFYGASPYLFEFARELRYNPTEAETLLWEKLKGKQLGVKFRRQHPIYQYIADFYCHQIKLVIEVDGDYHRLRDQIEYDKFRSDDLSELGIEIIRFSNDLIETDINTAIEIIQKIIVQHTPNP